MATAQNELQMASTAYRTAWSGAASNYDILANDPLKLNVPGIAIPGEGRPCRWIICGTAGTVTVTGLDGVNVILTAIVGQRFDLQAVALVAAGSTVTNLTVFW